MPIDLAAALASANRAALVVPGADLATLVVTGGDRRSWLNGLLTCDLAPMKEGEATYGLFVQQKGRVLSDAMVFLDGDGDGDAPDAPRVLLAVPRAVVGELRASLEHYLIMEDAELTEGAFDVQVVHGPRSAEVLAAMRGAGARGAPLDRTGLGGALVFVDASARDVVAVARDAALAAVGGSLGDDASWDALRVVRRVPRFGVDFDGATYPQEAGLEKRAVSFNKGCYLGQEVVCMLELRGHVKRKLVGMRVIGAEIPARGADVTDAGGESVGAVTSSAAVPGEGVLALAMVKRAKADPGSSLRVNGGDAVVVAPAE